MNKPLVTIIMPVYNRSLFVVNSLHSVVEQTYTNWECIIVNDGSTDNSEAVILDFINGKSEFVYYKIDNGGAAKARNYGINRSQGTYILPLDSDDLIDSTYLEKAVKLFEENQNLKIVYGKAKFIGAKEGVWNLPDYSYPLFLIYNMIYNSSMYKRTDFDAVGGYTIDSMFEDWDFWIKLLKNGGDVYQIPEVMFYCGIHKEDSITIALKGNEELFNKNMNQLYKDHIDTYLKVIGNPITLERQRRTYEGLIESGSYKSAERIMNNYFFKGLRSIRISLKKLIYGK